MPRFCLTVKKVKHYKTTVEVEADDKTEAAKEAMKVVKSSQFVEMFTDTLVVLDDIKELDAPPSTAHH